MAHYLTGYTQRSKKIPVYLKQLMALERFIFFEEETFQNMA